MNLILDVKELIASHSAEAFYGMWICDAEFREYAPKIARKYIHLFRRTLDVYTKRTLLFDKLHSFDDEPAYQSCYGSGQEWYRVGRYHRDDDKPAIINSYGKRWYRNGKLHRLNGHASKYILNAGQSPKYLKEYYIAGIHYKNTKVFAKARNRFMRINQVDIYGNPFKAPLRRSPRLNKKLNQV